MYLPPCPSSCCPQRERTSEHMMFRALVIKLEYPGKQICSLLTSFSSDFMSLNSLVLLIFLFFARLPLSRLLLGLTFPFTSCPCERGHMGSVQPVQGALSLADGPASVHNVLCTPRAAGCVGSMFRVSQMKGLKGEKNYHFSIPVI